MKKKYNFALVPNKEDAKQFVFCATKLSFLVNEVDKYKLSENTIPHVTLCHFDADENEIDLLWERFQTLPKKSIFLTFENIRSKSYPSGPYSGINWYSLMPNEIDELHLMHNDALSIIEDPKSFSGKDYDPHLTLLNSRDMRKIDEKPLNSPLMVEFIIAITERDDVGQATKIVHCHDIKPEVERECRCIML